MKVWELIEVLKYQDKDADVHFTYNYGDHWRTQVAPKIRDVFEGAVAYSEYHRMDKVAEDEDAYDDDTGDFRTDVKKVVLIGG
jgi:hypothetical protein